MRRNTISTGLDHQREVAVWVRKRLVDAAGRRFYTSPTGRTSIGQHGVILADGVGLGKTWEALAASALVLIEMSKERQGGGRRQNVRKQPARILVLCPPGLVSKWSREVRDPKGFSDHLKKWAVGRQRSAFVLDTLTEPFEIRRRTDLPKGKIRGSRVELPAGTYVCNWNVLKKVRAGRSRLAALRSQSWDILIVDEAHHREAREAIGTVENWARPRHRKRPMLLLTLTATPFQLEPREIHQLLAKILDGRHSEYRVLSKQPVSKLVAALAGFFNGGPPPDRHLKRKAEEILQQIIVRSEVRGRGRGYYLINRQGVPRKIVPPGSMGEGQLQDLLLSSIAPSREFETWYLQRRLQLADGEPTFIPTKLRQALSTPAQARAAGPRSKGPPHSPRLDALVAWARSQIERDLVQAARDGYPRKILVFTSFVGKAAHDLQDKLTRATNEAWKNVRNQRAWREMAKKAPRGIEKVANRIETLVKCDKDKVLRRSRDAQHLVDALWSLAKSPDESLVRDLFGSWRFRQLVIADLTRRLAALAAVLRGDRDRGWWTRLHREERRSLRATIRTLGRVASVATYTGHDDRKEREAAGEAFRSPLAPWVLVASNVGSEGIDLHTFSAHLVHFDIEWNPARMEQREGQSDRVGRLLSEPVNIYYVLVRGTYDERMLHQLVARQRWHSVLLGQPGARLARDRSGRVDARLIDVKDARKLALDLRPGSNR